MTHIDPLKLIELQGKGYTVFEVAQQFGVEQQKVRRLARKIGCPFPIHPAKNYTCLACLRPHTVTYHVRTCTQCKESQRRAGVDYVETYEVSW